MKTLAAPQGIDPLYWERLVNYAEDFVVLWLNEQKPKLSAWSKNGVQNQKTAYQCPVYTEPMNKEGVIRENTT